VLFRSAENFDYDITIILTEGQGKPLFYPLSDKVKVVNLDINFEELWRCSFIKKIFVYLKKQRIYKRQLTAELMRLRPDITVSLLRREINFLCDIDDGSKKVGEMHINRANYRSYSGYNIVKKLFSRLWLYNLIGKLRRLDKFVVLTDADKRAWTELSNVVTIPNPLSFKPAVTDVQPEKRILAVGRYSHEKGFDLLLESWAMIQNACPDWRLEIFGDGDREPYYQMMDELKIDPRRCILNGRTANIQAEYARSMISVCSSRFEGFGMVLVEAMACGLPCVGFNVGGIPEMIDHEVNGYVAEYRNSEDFARGILWTIDPERHDKLSVEARSKAEETYSEQHIAHLYNNIYARQD
jgi:glycosyltransferase involved in cell wall biosynthesis